MNEHDDELDALTRLLERLKAENARLLASLHEEQRQRWEISRALGAEGLEPYGETISRIVRLRAEDAPRIEDQEWAATSAPIHAQDDSGAVHG